MRKRVLFFSIVLCLVMILLVGSVSAAEAYTVQNVTKQGSTVSASVTCGNEPVQAICAVYDESGKMLSSQTKTISKTDAYEFSFPDGDFSDAKVFLLDRNGAPVCESRSLSDSGSADRGTVFVALKSHLLTNPDPVEYFGYKAIVFDQDQGEIAIFYDSDQDKIIVHNSVSDEGSMGVSMLSVNESSTESGISFRYYNGEQFALSFSGSCKYDASEFYPGMDLRFDSYDGPSSQTADMEEILSDMIRESLTDLQKILSEIDPTGTYSIKDLGFAAYSFD